MSYVPKYYADLTSAISIIKSNLRADLRGSLTDSYLEQAIEICEMETDAVLITAGFNVDSLDSTQKAHARDMTTARVLIYIAGVLPISTEEKREYLVQMRDRLLESERYFIKREYPAAAVKSKYKRMKPGYGREWEEDV